MVFNYRYKKEIPDQMLKQNGRRPQSLLYIYGFYTLTLQEMSSYNSPMFPESSLDDEYYAKMLESIKSGVRVEKLLLDLLGDI